MTTEDIEVVYVCHCCICDRFLAEMVRTEGSRAACSYCDRVSEALTLDDLAERVHEVLRAHFELTPNQPKDHEYALVREDLWERPGYPVEDVIADVAGVSPKDRD